MDCGSHYLRFYPPILMHILEYRIKKTVDGNGKMKLYKFKINSKNVHKNMRTFE